MHTTVADLGPNGLSRKKQGSFYQATPDIVLHHIDCPLYLPIGFAVANSDAVIDNL